MAVRKRPLSATVLATLKKKLKVKKVLHLDNLKKFTDVDKVLFYHLVQDQEYLWRLGLWPESIALCEDQENTIQI